MIATFHVVPLPDHDGSSHREGTTAISDLLKYQARALGIGIANVINITGVERIIVGGTIYHELESDLMPIVKENAEKYSIGNGMEGVKILLNDLGDEAPALGASMLN